jgi:hypothetical protein
MASGSPLATTDLHYADAVSSTAEAPAEVVRRKPIKLQPDLLAMIILLAGLVSLIAGIAFIINAPYMTIQSSVKFYQISSSEMEELAFRVRSQATLFVAGGYAILGFAFVRRRELRDQLNRVPKAVVVGVALGALLAFPLFFWLVWWPPDSLLSWQLCSKDFQNSVDSTTSVLVPCYSSAGDPIPAYNQALAVIALRQDILIFSVAVVAFAILGSTMLARSSRHLRHSTSQQLTVTQRVDAIRTALLDSSTLIDEIKAELELRTVALTRLQAAEEAYEERARQHSREAAAVSVLVEKVIADAHRKLERSSRRDQLTFFTLGVLASIVVTMMFNIL